MWIIAYFVLTTYISTVSTIFNGWMSTKNFSGMYYYCSLLRGKCKHIVLVELCFACASSVLPLLDAVPAASADWLSQVASGGRGGASAPAISQKRRKSSVAPGGWMSVKLGLSVGDAEEEDQGHPGEKRYNIV